MPIRKLAGKGSSTPTDTKRDIVVDESKASVTYSISITKNLDNYESLKIQSGITIPLGASDELLAEMDALLVIARDKVVERLQSDLTDVLDTLK